MGRRMGKEGVEKGWKPVGQWKRFVGRFEKGSWNAVGGNTPFGLWV
jgi:hypothetical protein